MLVRHAVAADRAQLLSLWCACFDDGDAFQNWFFDNRFLPEYCMLAEEDGVVVGGMHGIPQTIMLRGKLLPCVVIGGVATLPAQQGKGVMRAVFTAYMRSMRAKGIALIAHRPQRLTTFFRFGHFPSSNIRFLTLDGGAPRPAYGDYTVLTAPGEMAVYAYPCYAAFAGRYSGMLARTYPDMAFKCADYASDGMRCLLVRGADGAAAGYCIYENGADALYGEETVAQGAAAYRALYAAMANEAGARTLTLKLPEDAVFPAESAVIETKAWNVLGAANVAPLMAAAFGGLAGVAVEATDDTVPENAGVYDGRGERTDDAPAVRLPAGRLVQWLVGYRSLVEILESGEAEALDASAAARLNDLLPVTPCCIIDEY